MLGNAFYWGIIFDRILYHVSSILRVTWFITHRNRLQSQRASYLILPHRTGNMVIATWWTDSLSCLETDFGNICTSTIDITFSRSPTATILTRKCSLKGDPSSISFEQCSEWSDHPYKQIIDNLWEIARHHPLRKWHSAVRAQLCYLTIAHFADTRTIW